MWGVLLLPVLLLILAALRPLALPDEGRYAEVGRWMWMTGDWLTPRLDGIPFFHKPPLLYWLEASAMTVLGASPWAARLVVALHACLMMGLMVVCTRHIAGADVARRATWMFGSSLAFLMGGQYVNHDMMVATWMGVAIWCFARALMHDGGVHAGDRGEPEFGCLLRGGDEQCGGAVGDLRRGTRGDRAVLGEGRTQLGHAFQRGAVTGILVRIDNDIALAGLDHEGNDFIDKLAGLLRGFGLVLAGQCTVREQVLQRVDGQLPAAADPGSGAHSGTRSFAGDLERTD